MSVNNSEQDLSGCGWEKPENWQFAGAVGDYDFIDLLGENPWNYKWKPTGRDVNMPDPLYPSQSHVLRIYQIDGKQGPIVFAAGEFSSNIWGFFVLKDVLPSTVEPVKTLWRSIKNRLGRK